MRGRGGVRRGRGELRRPGGAQPGPLRQEGGHAGPRRAARGLHVAATWSTRIQAADERRGPAPDRGRRRRAATATWRSSSCATRRPATVEEVPTSWLFVFIGASPRTDWLGDDVARDDKGFLLTGPELLAAAGAGRWPLERPPFVLETSMPGRLRRRRRAAGLDEAGRLGGRRGRDGGPPRAPLPGDGLMTARSTICRAARPAPRRARRRAARPSSPRPARRCRSRRATSCSARAGRPTSGGCCSTGTLELVRRVGHEDTVLGDHGHAGPVGRRVPGLGPARRLHGDRPRPSAAAGCCGCPPSALGELAQAWFPFGVHLIKGLIQTVRNIESTARQREALVALGTLAAGLAHEINNPASAATRAVDALQRHLRRAAGLAAPARRGRHLRRAVRRARRAPAGSCGRRRWPTSPLAAARTGRTSCPTGSRSTSVDRGLAGRTRPRRRRRRRRLVRAGGRDGRRDPALDPALHWVASSLSTAALLGRGEGVDPAGLRPGGGGAVLLPARPRLGAAHRRHRGAARAR